MTLKTGSIYFIKDEFFEKVKDPFLKINYKETKRPHYYALEDKETGIFWFVPCSSKIEKFERIVQAKKDNHKPIDSIKIVKIQGKKTVLLFQDMFPIIEKYIEEPYIRGGQEVKICDEKVILELEKTAKKVIKLIRHGVKFTPTQPDAQKIKELIVEELR